MHVQVFWTRFVSLRYWKMHVKKEIVVSVSMAQLLK
jgi:hypothetical protein